MASPSPSSKQNSLDASFEVDYVISYRFGTTAKDKEKESIQFEKLVRCLAGIGLATEARHGDDSSVLLFVKVAAEDHLWAEVYRSRVKDWLHGVRQEAPEDETRTSISRTSLTEAERLRIVYQMITNPHDEGGAGITPREGDWTPVESIFPLHDDAFNHSWLKSWSFIVNVNADDLDRIRDRFGEKVAFYFAFLQSYFTFLIFPSVFGFSAWLLLGTYSPVYAVINCLWCVVFVEYWKHQETDLAVRWGVRGVSGIQVARREFLHEKEVKDPVTGEIVKIFPATKRLLRQLLQIPFAFIVILVLGSFIATCFGIEVFLSEIYQGPFKSYLTFLPTVLLTAFIPMLTTALTGVARRLNDYENYQTTDAYGAAMTQKTFVLDFITSYMPIFLTAFVYVPFGRIIVPRLDVFNLTAKVATNPTGHVGSTAQTGFQINPARLKHQIIYFAVTAQMVNFAMEMVVPYIKRKGFNKVKEIQSQRAAKRGGAGPGLEDIPEEAAFLARVRGEAELEDYDVDVDLREMCIQYGYLTLFSVVWPLTPVSFILNNWAELRSDAAKICYQKRRPIPWRADTIGPWLDSLGFLSWLGSISTAALVYLFHGKGMDVDGTPSATSGWALLLAIFFSEHIYLIVRLCVRIALSKIESPGLRKERGEKFLVRKRYLEESLGKQQAATALSPVFETDKIDRASLEEQARAESLSSSRVKVEEKFWLRQRNWTDTVKVGVGIIQMATPDGEKKMQ